MRAVKLFKDIVEWRWTPCVAIIGSSLLYVLIAIIVVPSEIASTPPGKEAAAGRAVTVPEGMEPNNAFTGSPRRPTAPPVVPPPPAPEAPPAMAPPPPPPPEPPPPPAEEPAREEPPPPPPAPPPPPPQEEEVEEEAEPVPAPTAQVPPQTVEGRARFLAAPLRFMSPGSNANPDTPPPQAQPEGQ
jgi:hypothetical protein